MAKRKFNNWDNQERFETAHTSASDAVANLEGVVNEELYEDINKGIDAMRDQFHDLQAYADGLEDQLENAVSQEDYDRTVGRLESDIAVLKARLQLNGLSTSTAKPRARRNPAAFDYDDC